MYFYIIFEIYFFISKYRININSNILGAMQQIRRMESIAYVMSLQLRIWVNSISIGLYNIHITFWHTVQSLHV